MQLILFTSTLSKAAGGLSASVPYLANGLARMSGAEVHVLGIEDPDDPCAAQHWGPSVHAHHCQGPRAFGYAPGMRRALTDLKPSVTDVQGLWTYPSFVNLRHHQDFGTPYVITPRGMLDPWARTRSRWKKKAVRLWFEDAHLANAACLRATAEMEAGHFRSFGLKNPIAIVPNGVDVPAALAPRSEGDRRRLLFLSRIHPKKGLPYLLQSWAALERELPSWDLVIAGPDELNHTSEMKALANQLGLKNVFWHQAVHGQAKSELYRSADLFVLPTHAENFGLVIAEALAHEVPVITTRNAPWEGLKKHRCGWWIDLHGVRLQEALLEAATLPREELHAMGARGRAWMARDYGWDSVCERMLSLYEWVAGKGSRPNFLYIE